MVVKTPKRGIEDMKEKITLRKRGQFTLPKAFMDELNLHEGDSFELRLEDGKMVLVPMIHVPADQAWFWTEKWQAEEREAEEDLRLGRVKSFDNVHDLIAELDSDEIDEWENEDE